VTSDLPKLTALEIDGKDTGQVSGLVSASKVRRVEVLSRNRLARVLEARKVHLNFLWQARPGELSPDRVSISEAISAFQCRRRAVATRARLYL
jgi:hypothetical protein